MPDPNGKEDLGYSIKQAVAVLLHLDGPSTVAQLATKIRVEKNPVRVALTRLNSQVLALNRESSLPTVYIHRKNLQNPLTQDQIFDTIETVLKREPTKGQASV